MEAVPASDAEDTWEKLKTKVEEFRKRIAADKKLLALDLNSDVETRAFQCLECWELLVKLKFERLSETELIWILDQLYEPTVTIIIGNAWFKACTKHNIKYSDQLTTGLRRCLEYVSGELAEKGLRLHHKRLRDIFPFIEAAPWMPGPAYVRTIMNSNSDQALTEAVTELFKQENDVMILKRLAMLLRSKKYDKVVQIAFDVYSWADFIATEEHGFVEQKLWCNKDFSGGVAVIWLAAAVSLALKQYALDKARPQDPLRPIPVLPPHFAKEKQKVTVITVKEALGRLKITKSCPCPLIVHWPQYTSLYNHILITAVYSALLNNDNLEEVRIHNLLEEWISIYSDLPDSEFSPLQLLHKDDLGIQSSSFYTIAGIMFEQKRPAQGIKMFVKGILCDINRMDALYIADEKAQQEESWREVRKRLATKFAQLKEMLPSKLLKKEVILTMFSLDPTDVLLEKLFNPDSLVTSKETCAGFKDIVVVVDAQEVILDDVNSYDLMSVIQAPRDSLLNWTSSDEHEHRQVCEEYLKTGGKTIIRNDELKNLDIDYSQFAGRPRTKLTYDMCVEPGFGMGDKRRRKLLARGRKRRNPKTKTAVQRKVNTTKRKPLKKSTKVSVKQLQKQKKRVNIKAGSNAKSKNKIRGGGRRLTQAQAKELQRQHKRDALRKLTLECVGLEDDLPPPLSPVGLTRAPSIFPLSPEKFYDLVMRETPDQASVNFQPDDALRMQTLQTSEFIRNGDSLYDDLVNETNFEDSKPRSRRRTTLKANLEAALAKVSEIGLINPLYLRHSSPGCAVKLVRVIPDSLVKKFAQSLSFDVLIEIIQQSLRDMDLKFSGKSPTDLKNMMLESQKSGKPLISHLVEQKLREAGTSSQTFQFPTAVKDYVGNLPKAVILKPRGPKKITTERYDRAIIDATGETLEKNLVFKRAALGLEFVDGKLIRASPLPFVEMPEIVETPTSESGICRVKILPVNEVLREHVETKIKAASTTQRSIDDQKGFDCHFLSESHHTPAVMSMVKQIVSMVYDIEDCAALPDKTEQGNFSHLERFLRDAMIWQRIDANEVNRATPHREMPVLSPQKKMQIKTEPIPKKPRSRKPKVDSKEQKTLKNTDRWGGKARLLEEERLKPLPQHVQVLPNSHRGIKKPKLLKSSTLPSGVAPSPALESTSTSSLSIPVSVIRSPPGTTLVAAHSLVTQYRLPESIFLNHTISRCDDSLSDNHRSQNIPNPNHPVSKVPDILAQKGAVSQMTWNLPAFSTLPSPNGSFSDVRSSYSNFEASCESEPSSIESLNQLVSLVPVIVDSSHVQSVANKEPVPVIKTADFVPVIKIIPSANQEVAHSHASKLDSGLNCETNSFEKTNEVINGKLLEGYQTGTGEGTLEAVLEHDTVVGNASGHDSEPSESNDNPSTPDSDVSYAPSSVDASGSGATATTEFSTEEENISDKKPVRRRKRVRNKSGHIWKKSKSSSEIEESVKETDSTAKKTDEGTERQEQTKHDLKNCSVLVESTDFVVQDAPAIVILKTLPNQKKPVDRKGKKKKPSINYRNDSTETEDSVSTPPPLIDLISDGDSNQDNKVETKTLELHHATVSSLLCTEELDETTEPSDVEAAAFCSAEPTLQAKELNQASAELQVLVIPNTCGSSDEAKANGSEVVTNGLSDQLCSTPVASLPSSHFATVNNVDEEEKPESSLKDGEFQASDRNSCDRTTETVLQQTEFMDAVNDEIPMSTVEYERDDSDEETYDPLGEEALANSYERMEDPTTDEHVPEIVSSSKEMDPEGDQVDEEQPQLEFGPTPVAEEKNSAFCIESLQSENHFGVVFMNGGDNHVPVPSEILNPAHTVPSYPPGSSCDNMETKSTSHEDKCNLISFVGTIDGESVTGENATFLDTTAVTGMVIESASSRLTCGEQEVLRVEIQIPFIQNDICNFTSTNKNASDVSPPLPLMSSDETEAHSSVHEEQLISVCQTTDNSSGTENDDDPLETSNLIPLEVNDSVVNFSADSVHIFEHEPDVGSSNKMREAGILVVHPPNSQSEVQQSSQNTSGSPLTGSRKRKGEPIKSLPCLPALEAEVQADSTRQSLPLYMKTRTSSRTKEVQITAEIKCLTRRRTSTRTIVPPAESTFNAGRHRRSAKPPKKLDGYQVGPPKRSRKRSPEDSSVLHKIAAATGKRSSKRKTKAKPGKKQKAIPARTRSTSDCQSSVTPALNSTRTCRKSTPGYEQEPCELKIEDLDIDITECEGAASDADAGPPSDSHDNLSPSPVSLSTFTAKQNITRKTSNDSSSYPSEVESMDTEDEIRADLESSPLLDDSCVTDDLPPVLSQLSPVQKRRRAKRGPTTTRPPAIDCETPISVVDLTTDDGDAPPPTLKRYDVDDS